MAYTNQIREWEGDTTQYWDNYEWRSKDFLFDKRMRMSVGRVLFASTDLSDYDALVKDRNDLLSRNRAKMASGVTGILPGGGWDYDGVVLGGDALEVDPGVPVYSGDDEINIKIYVDGVEKLSYDVPSAKPFSLPGGFRGIKWAIKITGNVTVQRIAIASTTRELMAIEEEDDDG